MNKRRLSAILKKIKSYEFNGKVDKYKLFSRVRESKAYNHHFFGKTRSKIFDIDMAYVYGYGEKNSIRLSTLNNHLYTTQQNFHIETDYI